MVGFEGRDAYVDEANSGGSEAKRGWKRFSKSWDSAADLLFAVIYPSRP